MEQQLGGGGGCRSGSTEAYLAVNQRLWEGISQARVFVRQTDKGHASAITKNSTFPLDRPSRPPLLDHSLGAFLLHRSRACERTGPLVPPIGLSSGPESELLWLGLRRRDGIDRRRGRSWRGLL